MDFAGEIGDEVTAMTGGAVIKVDEDKLYGKTAVSYTHLKHLLRMILNTTIRIIFLSRVRNLTCL